MVKNYLEEYLKELEKIETKYEQERKSAKADAQIWVKESGERFKMEVGDAKDDALADMAKTKEYAAESVKSVIGGVREAVVCLLRGFGDSMYHGVSTVAHYGRGVVYHALIRPVAGAVVLGGEMFGIGVAYVEDWLEDWTDRRTAKKAARKEALTPLREEIREHQMILMELRRQEKEILSR